VSISDTTSGQFEKHITNVGSFNTSIIATTGWTTSDLKAAITNQNPPNDFDIVTLLIGVNNQYQNKPFSLFEQEFPELIVTAVQKAKGKKKTLLLYPFRIMPIRSTDKDR